jgi:hypothetical protein
LVVDHDAVRQDDPARAMTSSDSLAFLAGYPRDHQKRVGAQEAVPPDRRPIGRVGEVMGRGG